MNGQKTIYLVRHGQSRYNLAMAEERAANETVTHAESTSINRPDLRDCDLTEHGVSQAKVLSILTLYNLGPKTCRLNRHCETS